ncbi:MAG TPA: hypothetical protein ENI29_21090 [bacterium]|nr:hypothetical protein [bacterium]
MNREISKKMTKCYNCGTSKDILHSIPPGLRCKICYSNERSYLFKLLMELISEIDSHWGYSKEQIEYFRGFDIPSLKHTIHAHYSFRPDSYHGLYVDEIEDVVLSIKPRKMHGFIQFRGIA